MIPADMEVMIGASFIYRGQHDERVRVVEFNDSQRNRAYYDPASREFERSEFAVQRIVGQKLPSKEPWIAANRRDLTLLPQENSNSNKDNSKFDKLVMGCAPLCVDTLRSHDPLAAFITALPPGSTVTVYRGPAGDNLDAGGSPVPAPHEG